MVDSTFPLTTLTNYKIDFVGLKEC